MLTFDWIPVLLHVADFEALMRQASAEDLDLFSPVGSDTSND
jgi:hypothetical protein